MNLRVAIALAFCLTVSLASVSNTDDPSDIADEFLDQMSFSEMNNDQNRGQQYASELEGLNKVEADEENHPDIGESDDLDSTSAAFAQCGEDQECHSLVQDLLLGESTRRTAPSVQQAAGPGKEKEQEKEKEKEGPPCKDYHVGICRYKKDLCAHAKHGASVTAQCPKSCGACALLAFKAEAGCRNKSDACVQNRVDKYCNKNTVVKDICPEKCGSC